MATGNKMKIPLSAKLSATPGVKPKPAMLRFGETAWNIKDGALYGKMLDANGKEKIVSIGGGKLISDFFHEIMFSTNETHVIWKYIDQGEDYWQNLIPLDLFFVPEFSLFYILGQPTDLLHLDSIPADLTFVWETNNCINIIEDSIKISFDNTIIVENHSNENPKQYTANIGSQIVKTYGESVTFVISANTRSHGVISKEFTVSWSLQKVYHGSSSNSNPAQSVTHLPMSIGKINDFTLSFSSMHYILFACPDNMHNEETLSVKPQGCLNTSMVKLTTNYIHDLLYNIYISAPMLGSTSNAKIKLLY